MRKWMAGEVFPSGLALARLLLIGGLAFQADLMGWSSLSLTLAAQSEERQRLLRALDALDRTTV